MENVYRVLGACHREDNVEHACVCVSACMYECICVSCVSLIARSGVIMCAG